MLRQNHRSAVAVIVFMFFFLEYIYPLANAVAAPSVGAPQVSPSAVPAGSPTVVTVTSLIQTGPKDPPVIPTGVYLQRVDVSGNFISTLGTMLDDGTNGDTVAGDGIFTLRITVNESQGGEFRIRVSAPFKGVVRRVFSAVTIIPIQQVTNQSPIAEAGSDQTLTLSAGQTNIDVQLDGSASRDPDGSIAAYTWTGNPDPSDVVNPKVSLPAGTYIFTLRVTDNQGALSAPDTVTITVLPPPNQPPVANAGANRTISLSPGQTSVMVTLDGSGSQDPDGNITQYLWTGTPDPTDVVNPTISLSTGIYTFTLMVTDNNSLQSPPSSVTITVLPPPNQPPVFTSAPVTQGVTTVVYYYQPVAQDPEGGAVQCQLVSGPLGMTFSNDVIRWVPTNEQAGDHRVEIKATDPQNAPASQVFTVHVIEYNLSPTITSIPKRYAKTSEQYEYRVLAFDPEGKSVIYSFAESPPTDMSIDPASGMVRWSPVSNMIGTHRVAVRATDPPGASDTQVFTLEVFDPAADLQILSPTGAYAARVGQSLTLSLQANYPKAVFSAEPIPVNASIAQNSFTFTPGANQEGIHAIAFRARLGDMEKSSVVQITATRDNRAPEITPIGLQIVQEGAQLAFTVQATDLDQDLLIYSAPGLNVANAFFNELTHQFFFSPGAGQAGNYNVTFSVSDGPASSQMTVPIKVQPASGETKILDLVVDPVTSPTFQSAVTLSGSVAGQVGPPPPPQLPRVITGLSPASIKQGQSKAIEITGLNTNFTQGTSKADFGDGITVESLTVLSSTRAQASIRADRLAQVGTRQVRMLGTSEVPSVVAFTMERGSASVSGTVIDLFTQQPLANASVNISGTTISVLTDDQGRFKLDGVPPGTGTLIVTLPNYDVRRFSVTVGPNESMPFTDPILLNALARPPSLGGTLPRAATVASVVDRGVTIKGGGLTFEQAKAVINDTMIAVGGTEAGVLDEAGNQLNPKVEGAGALSLTQEGVEGHSKALILGDTYTLRDFVDALKGAFRFPLGLEIGHVVAGFQGAVDEAWAKPNDPGSAMAIVLFNEGVTLSPMPPIITPDTRFNRFQVFLLVSSFLVFNQSTLEPSIEGILQANGIDYESLLPPPKFSHMPSRSQSRFADAGLIEKLRARGATLWSFVRGLVLPTPAYAANQCADTSPLCNLEDLTAKKTFSKAWRMIGANAIAEAGVGALYAAGLTFAQQSVMSYVMASSGGRFGTAIAALNLASASVQGFVAILTYKLVIGWYIALVAASFEPPPAEGVDSYVDNNGNFVIKFDLSPEHKRIANLPDSGKLKRNFAYHLYRFPNCAAPADARNTEYIPLKAEPDYGHSENKKGPPYLGPHRFVVPKPILHPGRNYFRIRVFEYFLNRDSDLVEGIAPFDSNEDGFLSFDEFKRAGLGGGLAFANADTNDDLKLDSSEFKNVLASTELEIAPKVPITIDLRKYMGRMDLQPGSYPGQLTVTKGELRAGALERINTWVSEVYLTRQMITDFHANSPFSRGNAEFLPQIEYFVNNKQAFILVDDATIETGKVGKLAIVEGDAKFGNQIAEKIYQKNLAQSPTLEQTQRVQEMVAASRLKQIAVIQNEFSGTAMKNVDIMAEDVKTGRLTQGRIDVLIPKFPSAESLDAASVKYTYELTPGNKEFVIGKLKWHGTEAYATVLQANIRITNAKNQALRVQEPMLKDALKTTSGLTEAEIESRFAAYMPKKAGVGIRGQATAQLATEYEQGLRDYIQKMKNRRARVGSFTINEPPMDPAGARMVKSVGTFQNFSGGVTSASWMLLHFLQSVRVLSSEFTEACYTGVGPSVPLPSKQFPPSIEPYPGADEPNAVIVGVQTGPKQGLLKREYPGDHENIATIECVPPGFLSIDTQSRVYALNLASTEQFGGRIFRYSLKRIAGEDGVPQPFGAEQELVGAVNYFSLVTQLARPAYPVAMVVGPKFKALDEQKNQVVTQDLFVADIDIIDGKKRILKVPISLIDTKPSAYGSQNRHRIVGQTVLESDEFSFTGPSDMEVGPDPYFLVPEITQNSVIMLSDESNILAFYKDPKTETYLLRKVISIPARRWSGLAFDRMGRFYFADYKSGDIFVMLWETLKDIVFGDSDTLVSNEDLIPATFPIARIARPGDIEVEWISSHPGGVLHVSTFDGIVPITFPIIGRLGDATEVRVSLFGIEHQAQVDAARGVFTVTPSREDLEAMRAVIRVKRLDAEGREFWQEHVVLLAEHGATILESLE